MKKKSFYLSLLAIMMVALFGGVMAACDCDDDDDDDDNARIIGTWTGVDGRRTLVLTFTTGNSGTYISMFEDQSSGTSTKTGTFTYVPENDSKGQIVMKSFDGSSGPSTDVFYYMIQGKTMCLYGRDYYDELQWVLTKTSDSGTTNDGTDSNTIVGTWTGIDGREILTLTFETESSGRYIIKYEDPHSGTETRTGTFTYIKDGNSKGQLLMRVYNTETDRVTTEVFYYVIEKRMMYLYEHDYYEDLEWTLVKQ